MTNLAIRKDFSHRFKTNKYTTHVPKLNTILETELRQRADSGAGSYRRNNEILGNETPVVTRSVKKAIYWNGTHSANTKIERPFQVNNKSEANNSNRLSKRPKFYRPLAHSESSASFGLSKVVYVQESLKILSISRKNLNEFEEDAEESCGVASHRTGSSCCDGIHVRTMSAPPGVGSELTSRNRTFSSLPLFWRTRNVGLKKTGVYNDGCDKHFMKSTSFLPRVRRDFALMNQKLPTRPKTSFRAVLASEDFVQNE